MAARTAAAPDPAVPPAHIEASNAARTVVDYFRCPDQFVRLGVGGTPSQETGFFTFSDATIGCGRITHGSPAPTIRGTLPHVDGVRSDGERVLWPFDVSEVVDNLRTERYAPSAAKGLIGGRMSRRLYYALRPLLSVGVRRHLQKIQLRGWRDIAFPRWPVDVSVERLMESVLVQALKSGIVDDPIPFIWFWPDGAPSCAMMTHDVESADGLAFCDTLMNLDDAFQIKSSFQLVPERRYEVTDDVLAGFRRRGFEVAVHDLNHDGYLFYNKQEFLRRAERINGYARRFHSSGFRSGAMYRNQSWYDAFEFRYDMSVPNVAHFEPQRGGCCTVMPYFIGSILELPLTTTQDYSLFHILEDYSIDLWRQQLDIIARHSGLASFITHPDYLAELRARAVYTELLAHLAERRADGRMWIALPADIDRWWRSRHQMRLVHDAGGWRIEGPESHRARIAYARLDGDRLVYDISSDRLAA